MRKYKYELALLFVVTVWGSNFPILKEALRAMDAMTLNMFRFTMSLLAVASVLALSARERSNVSWPAMRKHASKLIGLGLFGFCLYQFTFILGIDRTTAGNAALIMASAPIWTAVSALILGHERFTTMSWAGMLVSFVGALVAVLAGSKELSLSQETFLGNAILLAAAIMWGLYTTFARPVTQHISPLMVTLSGLVISWPFIVAAGIPFLEGVQWELVTWKVWVAIIYSGALSTGLTVYIWNTAILATGASRTASYGNLVPLIALIISAFYLHEPITFPQVVGGILIISGLIAMRRGKIRLAEA